MKKILQNLLLIALLCLPWVTMSQGFNFNCDFENNADTAAWDYITSPSSVTAGWYIGDGNSNGGEQGMYVSNDGGISIEYPNEDADYYAYRQFTLPAGVCQYSYDWGANGNPGTEYLRVALVPTSQSLPANASDITDISLPAGWIALDGGSALGDVWEFETKTGAVSVPTAGDYYLVFFYRSGIDGYYLPGSIDNISLEIPNLNCPGPTDVVVSNIIDESATISWQSLNTVSTWEVSYMAQDGSAMGSTVEYVSENSITLTGLSANTDYTFTVKGVCGDEYSTAVTGAFHTSCLLSLPYIESFETVSTMDEPECWTVLNGTVSVRNSYASDPNASDGEKYLKMNGGAIVATPYIPVALNTLEMSFSLRYDDYEAGDMQICYVAYLNDMANAQVLKTISPVDGRLHTYDVDLSTSNITAGGYLLFKQVHDADFSSYALDNVIIQTMSSCRRPASLEVCDITYEGAQLRWSSVEGAFAYEVVYGKVNDPESLENVRLTDLMDTTVIINELDAETNYYVWVRNLCGGENSNWRAGSMFTTQFACAQVLSCEATAVTASGIALSWSFNTEVGKPATQTEVSWKSVLDENYHSAITDKNYFLIQGLESSTQYEVRLRTICGADTSSAYTNNITTKMYGVTIEGTGNAISENVPTHTFYKTSYTQTIYPARDMVGVDTIRTIAYRLKSTVTATRKWNIYMGNIKRSYLSYSSRVSMDSLTQVAENIDVDLHEGWCVINLTTPFVYHADSNLVVAVQDTTFSYKNGIKFYGHNGSAIGNRSDSDTLGPNNMGYISSFSTIPDIAFIEPYVESGCQASLAVVGEVSSTSAELVWTAGAEGSVWQVEYKLASAEDWTIADNSVADTSLVINGLVPGSWYDFRVGTKCGTEIQYSTVVKGFTECAAIEVPYAENFSTATLNGCIAVGNIHGEDTPYIQNDAWYSSYAAGSYMILPAFVDEVSSLHTLFQIKSSQANAQVAVAVGNNTDLIDFEYIDTFAITTTFEYQPFECSFVDYAGTGHYIAFVALTKNVYIDDVEVEALPNCSYPANVTATEVTSNGVTISWSGDFGTSTGWMLAYHVEGDTHIDTVYVPANDNSYILTDLLSNTSYELWVSNICIDDTVTALNPVLFRTECAEVTLPYVESFESQEVDAYHPCWFTTNRHSYGISNKTAPNIVEKGGDYHNVMVFSDNVNMITSRIPTAANNIMINFDAMVEDAEYTGQLLVGFTTSNTDISNAVYADTITFTHADTWQNYTVSFTELTTAEEGYVIFRNINNTPYEDQYEGYGYEEYFDGYLDNVAIMIDYGCDVVEDIQVSNVTASTAIVSFIDTTATGNYTIGYSTINDINNISNTVSCTTTTYTLTDLEPNSEYYVWVRKDCDAGGSMWAVGPTFTTPCASINTLPYVENFDSYTENIAHSLRVPSAYPEHTLPNCWSFLNMGLDEYDYPQAFLCDFEPSNRTYADSAQYMVMVSSRSSSLFAVLPQFAQPIDSLQVSFTYCHEGMSPTNGTLVLGVMTDRFDTATFTPICTYPQTNVVTKAIHSFKMDNLDANTNYVIAFRYVNGTGQKFFLGLDNVVVDYAAECGVPEMVKLTSLTANSAELSWIGYSDNYNVQYRIADTTEWVAGPSTSTNSVTIDNLNAQTDYQVRVQSNCGTTVSEWSNIVAFHTPCGAVALPFSENFDSYTTDISTGVYKPSNYPHHTLPECWSFPVMDDPTPRGFLSSKDEYNTTGNSFFVVSSGSKNLYAVLPMMADTLNKLMINFAYRNESTAPACPKWELGVMTNPEDFNTFVKLVDLPIQTSMTEYEYNFSLDTVLDETQSYYITFRSGLGTGYYCSIDDIYVDYAPSCATPQSVTVSNISSNAVDITWNGGAANYELAYKAANATAWNIETMTEDSIHLAGLSAVMEYQVRVRALCSDTDTSHWSPIVSFNTPCGAMTLPFNEDFTDINRISELDCWQNAQGYLNDIQAGTGELTTGSSWSISSTRPLNNTEGNNVTINVWGTNIKGWLITPSINLSAYANFEFDISSRSVNNNLDADDKLMVLISNNNGTSWDTLHYWLGTEFDNIPDINDSVSVLHVTCDMAQYYGDTVQIAFYGESTVRGADRYFYIDNLSATVYLTPCAEPTNLAVNNITDVSAELSWNGDATTYDVAYRVQNTETWTTENVATTSYTLTGLQPSTTYDWKVRANCTADTADWVMSTFVTLEPSCIVPTELTAVVTEQSVAIDWTAAEGQTSWEINLTAEGVEDINQTVSAHPATIDDLTPATYTVKVRALCSEDIYSDWSEAIEFTIEPTPIYTLTVVSNNDAWGTVTGSGEYEKGTEVVLTATAAEGYHFVEWNDFNADNPRTITVTEDITYTATFAENDPEGIDGVEGDFQFAIYPNPTHDVTTISLNGVDGKVTISVVDMNGRYITTETIECGNDCEKRMDVSGLAQGTYFVRVLGDNIHSVRKLIVR